MRSEEQRRLLGAFIRSHRERMAPEGATGRRRTPGLRREELAAHAGIGTTWCTWIEQGRDVSVSPHALGRLAAALVLTPAERAYLFELAGRRDPDVPWSQPADEAPQSLRALIETVSCPAYGLDRLWNACCWNPAAARLFGRWLAPDTQKNLLRFVFTDPEARRLIPDWDNRATRLLAEFRVDYGRAFNDPRMHMLVESLKEESPLFAAQWGNQTVVAREGGSRRFAHAEDGPVSYVQHTFDPADRTDCKLVVLIPE